MNARIITAKFESAMAVHVARINRRTNLFCSKPEPETSSVREAFDKARRSIEFELRDTVQKLKDEHVNGVRHLESIHYLKTGERPRWLDDKSARFRMLKSVRWDVEHGKPMGRWLAFADDLVLTGMIFLQAQFPRVKAISSRALVALHRWETSVYRHYAVHGATAEARSQFQKLARHHSDLYVRQRAKYLKRSRNHCKASPAPARMDLSGFDSLPQDWQDFIAGLFWWSRASLPPAGVQSVPPAAVTLQERVFDRFYAGKSTRAFPDPKGQAIIFGPERNVDLVRTDAKWFQLREIEHRACQILRCDDHIVERPLGIPTQTSELEAAIVHVALRAYHQELTRQTLAEMAKFGVRSERLL